MAGITLPLLGLLIAAVPATSTLAMAQTQAKSEEVFDCSLLNNLQVGDKDFGAIAVMSCLHWPASFGRYPFSEVSELTAMLELGLNYQSVWAQFQADLKSDARNSLYCMRKEAMRTSVIADGSSCPEAVDAEVKEELRSSGESLTIAASGYWSCSDSGEGCICTRRDDVEHPTAEMKKRPKGCKMVHKDKCYGDCPRGYRKTFLLGGFRPVCTAVCAQTTHRLGCGVGCASTTKNCVLVVVNQVKEVAALVGKVVKYFKSGELLNDAKRMIQGVVEFTMTTLNRVVSKAKEIWGNFTRDKTELGILLNLMQFIKEVKGTALDMETILNKTQGFFLEVVDAELGWDTINLDWMANIVSGAGMELVAEAFKTLETFRYADCEIAGSQVHFSIEDCGQDTMVGPWGHVGTLNNRPRYQRIDDKSTVMEWDSRQNAWKLFYMDRSKGRGRWFGWIGLGWTEMYRSAQNTQLFPTEGWRRVEGPSPLPSVISVSEEPSLAPTFDTEM